MVVEAEEAEMVEEELVELVELLTDPIDEDNQQMEIADADDGKAMGVPEYKEVGHSMEVVDTWKLRTR